MRFPRIAATLAAVLAATTVAGHAGASTTTGPTVAAYQYAGTDDPDQSLDAYTDPSQTGRPWIVTIHGGSWSGGDRHNLSMQHPRDVFLAAGFAVFNLSYRLSPSAPWPAPRVDVMTALRFIRAHAAEFGIDPARGAAYGFSAGGHIAASVALYTSRLLGVQAVVMAAGVVRPQMVVSANLADWAAIETRCPLGDPSCASIWADFEPERHASAGDPPLLMFAGGADPLVPPAGAVDLAAMMRADGVASTAVVVPGVGHNETSWYGDPDRTAQMVAFVQAAVSPATIARFTGVSCCAKATK